jgi:adenylyltransferase/sulfurtransferase
MRFKPLGEEGQKKLSMASATVVGCGALGSVSSSLLARAGVGSIRIVDRDFVELDNLPRQHLFDESDVASNLPKAVAAARKLAAANSQIRIEPVVADVTPANVESFLSGVVVDGTDNFETRLLINDACVKAATPWVYGGAVGGYGMAMAIRPGRSACFRCFVEEIPEPGQVQTCDTAGIIAPASTAVGAIQAAEALKILVGKEVEPALQTVDLWEGRFSRFAVPRRPDCPCCGRRKFEFLGSAVTSMAVRLCGRGSVQVSPPPGRTADLAAIEAKLKGLVDVQRNDYLLRFEADGLKITVFSDGRAIVGGTEDESRARAAYARYVGS